MLEAGSARYCHLRFFHLNLDKNHNFKGQRITFTIHTTENSEESCKICPCWCCDVERFGSLEPWTNAKSQSHILSNPTTFRKLQPIIHLIHWSNNAQVLQAPCSRHLFENSYGRCVCDWFLSVILLCRTVSLPRLPCLFYLSLLLLFSIPLSLFLFFKPFPLPALPRSRSVDIPTCILSLRFSAGWGIMGQKDYAPVECCPSTLPLTIFDFTFWRNAEVCVTL